MPTIIAQGAQQTVVLPAGATLSVAGAGTSQVYVPQRPSVATPQLPTSSAGTSIGPFDCDATVRLVATSALSYDVLGPGDVLSRSGQLAFTAAQAASAQALVLGAGVSDASSLTLTAAMANSTRIPGGPQTYTIDAATLWGVGDGAAFFLPASGTVSFAVSGGPTVNGATTTLTRTLAGNSIGYVVLNRIAGTAAYSLSGA